MAYLLSKALPLLLLPLGAALALLALAVLQRRHWPVFAAMSLLWIFSTGVVSQLLWRWVEHPFQRRSVARAPLSDAIVVLSGGRHPAPGPAQISEWHDPDRFLAGVALFQSGRASRLLFTRGQNPFHPGLPPEGELYRAEAVDLGVPSTSIGLTDRVTNTAQEAKAIRRLLPQDRPRVLLVTSAFHMRRAQVLFERQGLTVLPYPVDFQARAAWAGSIWRDPLQWLPNSRSLDDSSRALRELMGRLAYRSW